MKKKSLTSIFLIVLVFISPGFIILEKEENLNPEFIILRNDECFADFLMNLKKMEALVFIPEDKVDQARSYNMTPLKLKRAKKANIKFIKAFKRYQMIKPEEKASSECNEPVVLTFKELGMKVFVRKRTDLNAANNVAVTPVPLPLPKPELKARLDDFTWKRTRNESELEHKVAVNESEFEAKIKGNENELAKKDYPGPTDIANESLVGFQEENFWKLYVPVKIQ